MEVIWDSQKGVDVLICCPRNLQHQTGKKHLLCSAADGGSDPSEYLHSKVCALCGLHPLCGGDLGLSHVLVSHLCHGTKSSTGFSNRSWILWTRVIRKGTSVSDSSSGWVWLCYYLWQTSWVTLGLFLFFFFFWVVWFWVFFGYLSSCSLLNILVIRS